VFTSYNNEDLSVCFQSLESRYYTFVVISVQVFETSHHHECGEKEFNVNFRKGNVYLTSN